MNNSFLNISEIRLYTIKVTIETNIDNNKLNGNNIDIEDLESYLNQQFKNNDIKVTHEKVKYEAKAYEEKIIQAGYYDTILITIDEGKGKNFWTLLYPEFFDISFDGENEIEYHSYFYDLFHN